MRTVLIDWREAHHPKDYAPEIHSPIAGGLDEGPLIAIPAASVHGPARRRTPSSIFKDVNAYLAHLAFYDGDVGAERYIGLVRQAPDKGLALQALARIQQALDPGSDGIPTIRISKKEQKTFDYCVETVILDPAAAENIQIESMGKGMNDLLDSHPLLKTLIGSEEGYQDADEEEW